MLKALADKYALVNHTKVIASRVAGNQITFVLEAGPKLTMSEAELIKYLDASAPPPSPAPAPPPKPTKTRKVKTS